MCDNYPLGARNDPRAPYNQKEPPELEFEVTISQTFSKTVKVKTSDYVEEEDWDDLGNCKCVTPNTQDTNWVGIYQEQHFTLQDLLGELKSMAQEKFSQVGEHTSQGKYLKSIIEACDDWHNDETEVVC